MKLRLAHNDEKKQPDWFLGKLSEVYNNGKIIVTLLLKFRQLTSILLLQTTIKMDNS